MTWYENISEEERKAVEELKKRTIEHATPKMLEDETVFYRFCKARDFKVDDAETMLMKHIAWRKEFKVDTILVDFKRPEVIDKYYPTSFIGFDKEGSFVRYFDYGLVDFKGIFSSVSKTDLSNVIVHTMEEDIERMNQNNKKTGKQATAGNYIYNLGNLTFSSITHKKGMELVISIFTMFLDNYPERLKYFITFNAAVFFPIVFPLFKTIVPASLYEKIRLFGSDGWKEYLPTIIDAEELPTFFGGNKIDPTGDPLCRTFINQGGQIPKSYYLCNFVKKMSTDPYVKKMTIARFSKQQIDFETQEPDSFLEWELETETRDISFALYFKEKSTEEPIELIPKQRIDTSCGSEKGLFKCERPGTYTIVFDNSYSWIYPKVLYYKVNVKSPNADEIQPES